MIKKIQKTKLLGLLAVAAVLSLVIGGSATANSHEVKPTFNANTVDIESGATVFVPMVIGERPTTDTEPLTREYCDTVDWCELRDEEDFLRLGQGEERYGQTGSELEVCSDETLNFWFYAHNGTSERHNNSAGDWSSGDTDNGDPFWNEDNGNLDGLAVAYNTAVSLSLPQEAGNSHTITASINADRAEEITDTVQITCSDETKEISVIYVAEETVMSTRSPEHGSLGNFELVGDLVDTDGAFLGYSNDDHQGIVPSCFEFASVIRGQLKVVVSEAEELEEDPETDPENPEDLPEADPETELEPEPDPEAEPEPETEPEPEAEPEPDSENPPEGKPDIPPLGGTGSPLALVVFASALSAVAYRLIRSRR